MVTDARSQYCDTTNDYLKYQIIVDEVAVDTANNTSTINIRVEAWRTDNYTTDLEGFCTVKVDGDPGVGAQGWDRGEKPISYYSDTEVYNISEEAALVVPHDADGTKTIYVEASCTWWYNSETQAFDSDYQGFSIRLTDIQVTPTYNVTIIPVSKTSNSITIDVKSKYTSDHWWFSADGGNNWVEFSTTEAKIQGVTISGLSPNTTYPLVARAQRARSFGRIDESAVYNIKTDGIPVSPTVARRITLYDQNETSFATNGLGSLIEAFSCKVTEELNGGFELEMEYPVDGIHFNDIDFGRLITANPNQYTGPQPFRIYAISKPHSGRVTINAAHISYDLSGYTVSPFSTGSLSGVFEKMLANSDVSCPFTFWTDISSENGVEVATPFNMRALLGGSDDSILGLYGGEYEFDIFQVKLHQQRGANRGVVIRYGKNLTSLKQEANCSNVYTGVRPYWYKEPDEENPDDGGLVDLPEKIITVQGEFEYTKILLLDLSDEFEEKPTATQLRSKANEFIESNNIGVPEVSLDVSFVQLSDSNEYSSIQLLEQVQLGDFVTVEFPKLKINANNVQCVKTVFDVLSQRYDSINLGTLQSNLTSTVSNNSNSVKNVATKSDVRKAWIKTKDDMFSKGKYVIMDYQTSPARLLSMDTASSQNAKEVYKFDVSGLSHSSNGVDGPYTVVMPQTGAMDTAFLKKGTIDGAMIKEGTVTLGSEFNNDYIDGKIDTSSKKLTEENKFSDSKIDDVTKKLYTNELVVGKGQFIPVSGGVNFVLFN